MPSDLGTKRFCRFCGTKFYDFNKHPIICPKCEAQFEPASIFKKRSKARVVKEEVLDVDILDEVIEEEEIEIPEMPEGEDLILVELEEDEESAGGVEEEVGIQSLDEKDES